MSDERPTFTDPSDPSHPSDPSEDPDPPAARLRLPPWSRVDDVGAVTAPSLLPASRVFPAPSREPRAESASVASPSLITPAQKRACRNSGFRVGTVGSRYGSVKLWRARSVNLRLLLLMFEPEPEAPEDPLVKSPRGKGRPGDEKGRPSNDERDALARRLALLLQPSPELLLNAEGPLPWPDALYPYQRDGVRALLQSRHLLLGDDMGLGKSIQAIAAVRLLLHRRELERALVVTPASLLEQWRREFLRWAPELRVMVVHGSAEERAWRWQYPAHVSLTSYEVLRTDAGGGRARGASRAPWGVVILDEAQRIKNRETEVSRACKQIPRERSWALTGTPLENRVEDVVSILEFVTGGTNDERRTTNEHRTDRTDGTDRTDSLEGPSSFVVGRSSLANPSSLRAALGLYQLRRRKAEVLSELPPKRVSDLVLPLTAAQRRAYERAEQEGLVALRERAEVRIENVLALLTRLKQICNFAPGGEASAKMEDLEGRIEELAAARQKALVFTQFAGEESGARRIARRLARFGPLVFTGEMSTRERQWAVERFQERDEHPVLILSLQTGGQGLNLQRASYVFHFDRSWNPAIEQQAESRSHRLGQMQPVQVYRYVMAETIEERIDALLRQKSQLFDEVVEGSSLDLTRLLEARDLFALVGLETRGTS